MKSIVKQEISDTIDVLRKLAHDEAILVDIYSVAETCLNALKQGNKILFAGNGGSAADSQHLAAELVSRFNYDRPGLAAFALTTDTSALTAIGNDYGYEKLFSRQLEAVGNKGDIFFGISTSGNSLNILNALKIAQSIGIYTVGLTCESGGKMMNVCDCCIRMPSSHTPKIQECHIVVGHIICNLIEQGMFPNP
ncbi:D-sedoheptulose-7-phosphate isomerase [Magnetovibrio blakemorei]|uniref:Phosphoheptose isomerase n=1 Tax=Magnetovibrio blakemorei TaxID=28181 RepID=A0A1E5Q6N9_9PROT|nr:D-sedoheptulose 7-phosphate isomerase [Magnetovibrio blakemorei]OEJ66071.1 phosphoheptose isomerase [Magnetovibrio blakemorei]OEJ66646.1 phosphoheptose isomerase [Magnetovibrio blakemorei]